MGALRGHTALSTSVVTAPPGPVPVPSPSTLVWDYHQNLSPFSGFKKLLPEHKTVQPGLADKRVFSGFDVSVLMKTYYYIPVG